MLVRRSSILRPHTVPRVVQRAARHLECNATAAVAIPPIPAPQQRIHARTNPHAAGFRLPRLCLAVRSHSSARSHSASLLRMRTQATAPRSRSSVAPDLSVAPLAAETPKRLRSLYSRLV